MLGKYQNNFTKKAVMDNHKTSGVYQWRFLKRANIADQNETKQNKGTGRGYDSQ